VELSRAEVLQVVEFREVPPRVKRDPVVPRMPWTKGKSK